MWERYIKIFDVQKGSDASHDLSTSFLENNRLGKIKNIGDYKSADGIIALQELLNVFWIQGHRSHLKSLANALYETRNVIKKTQHDLVDVIDDDSFKYGSIPYLLMLFQLEPNLWRSKGGKNSVQNLVAFLQKVLNSNLTIDITSFLCAHREWSIKRPERKDHLAQRVNTITFSRIQNIIRGFFENISKDYKVTFLQPGGDAYGMNAIFPTIFHNYLIQWKIEELMNWLNQHINALQGACKSEKFTVSSTLDHAKKVEDSLVEKYWENWAQSNTYALSEKDKLAEVAHHITKEDIIRVLSSHRSLDINSIDAIVRQNISNTLDDRNKLIVEQAINRYINKFSIDAKALYETMFYYLWGKETLGENKVSMGFDRDHDTYQSVSYGLWHNNKIDAMQGVPILYARRKDIVNTKDIDKLSFRQFWYHDGMYE